MEKRKTEKRGTRAGAGYIDWTLRWAKGTNRLALSLGEELLLVQPKPLDPTKLIVEFAGAQQINDAAHFCFNMAAMAIRRIRGQPARAPGGCGASTAQDRHAVKALLAFSAWCTACVAMRRARSAQACFFIMFAESAILL